VLLVIRPCLIIDWHHTTALEGGEVARVRLLVQCCTADVTNEHSSLQRQYKDYIDDHVAGVRPCL
jgi:hypothetical protein